MADIHAAKGDYEDAAKVLEKVKLEQTKREVTPADKAGTWLQIADYWFDAEDSVNAETYINKAAHLMHHVAGDTKLTPDEKKALALRFKYSQAKISDSKRKFIVAAWEYYGLSNNESLHKDD